MKGEQQSGKTRGLVSAIIPAFNEAKTIRDVIAVVERHPLIDEVIVVDDGSTDGTCEEAKGTSAQVICFPQNQGKASAMSAGVEAARNQLIFFLDADLHGLTPEIIDAIVRPVMTGQYGMFVAIRDRKAYWLNRILRFTPILGGERVLTKDLWYQVPPAFKKNFQIEIALNFYTKTSGRKMGFAVMPGLTQVIKEKKRGLLLGLYQRILMILDVCWAAARIYLLHDPGEEPLLEACAREKSAGLGARISLSSKLSRSVRAPRAKHVRK